MQNVEDRLDAIYRREARRLISVLTRVLGPPNLDLAEDVLQEAFAVALERWRSTGVPENPEGWLITAAKNRAIDAIRRERTRTTFAPDLARFLDSEWTMSRTVDEAFHDDWAHDDQLKMIFMCCAPKIAPENRIPLILKTLCGLPVPAIASALLTTPSTIHKRLYRTRKALEHHDFVLPSAEELPQARSTAHTVLYLLFNEGFYSTSGEPILEHVCSDAVAMTRLLVSAPTIGNSETVALLALMTFASARLDARLDASGGLVPLDRQDRRRWSRTLIDRGFGLLRRSSQMDAVQAGPYHLEAAIAARHCGARTFDETDWESICNLYDRLLDIAPTALTRLNRAVAISYRDGPDAALEMVREIAEQRELPHSHVVAATLANLYSRAGRIDEGRTFLETALAQAGSEHERRLIEAQFERNSEEIVP